MTFCLSEKITSFYVQGIQNLVVRYDKCLKKLKNMSKNREVCVKFENKLGFLEFS